MPPAAYVYVLKFFAAILRYWAEFESFLLYLRAVQVLVVSIFQTKKRVVG